MGDDRRLEMTKSLLQYSSLPFGVQIELRFALRLAVSEIQAIEIRVGDNRGNSQ